MKNKSNQTNQYMEQTSSQVIRLEERFNSFDEKLDDNKVILTEIQQTLKATCDKLGTHDTSLAVLNNKINTSNIVLASIAVVGNMIAGYLGMKIK